MNNVIVIKKTFEKKDGVEKETIHSAEVMPLVSLIGRYPLLRLWEHHQLITRLAKSKTVTVRTSSSEYGANYTVDIIILDSDQFDIYIDDSMGYIPF